MALSEEDVRHLAGELSEAERQADPIAPITGRFPDADIDDAYGIQLEDVRLRCAAGDSVRGHKVGLTARVMQTQFGVDRPDFGHLLASMFHPEGEPLPVGSLIAPAGGARAGVRARRPVAGTWRDCGRRARRDRVRDACARNHRLPYPGLADRHRRHRRGQRVVGPRGARRYPHPITGLDPRLIGAVLRRNGEIVETGASGAVLGSPAEAVAWLANTVAGDGVVLKAGDVIMPGTCTRAVELKPGDTVRADFEHLGHGESRSGRRDPSVRRDQARL